jgi:enterochelin esterase-like enzyme
MKLARFTAAAALLVVFFAGSLPAQFGDQTPQFVSPEVQADRKVTLRIYAPKAQAVSASVMEFPGMMPAMVGGQMPSPDRMPGKMTKADNGVWEITIGPISPGTYRYSFTVDGVRVVDPKNPNISESNSNVSSLVNVPGSEVQDTKDVPHGAVAKITYFSKTLGRARRMHVYTPPGYENSSQKYPVFYLLHGAGDCDEAWSSVGRAGFILDNLIAAKKAKPMIVVMPAGHTVQGMSMGGGRGSSVPNFAQDDFVKEFSADIMPYAESHYRVLTTRKDRAIAGLSMGGIHTLSIAIPNLQKFAYLGVYSSGLIGVFPMTMPGRGGAAPATPQQDGVAAYEQAQKAMLDSAELKKGLKLFWFATGKDDFLMDLTKKSVDLYKKHGFTVIFKESEGGHTWINWRDYLAEFAPMLFQ